MPGEPWTKAEEMRLINHLVAGGTVAESARLTGRSQEAIRRRAAGRGLVRPRMGTTASQRAKRASAFMS